MTTVVWLYCADNLILPYWAIQMSVSALQSYDVCLSYSSLDKPWVQTLRDALQAVGLSVWFDETVIPTSSDFGTELGLAVRNSRLLVVVLSRHAATSRWVELERTAYLAEHGSRGRVVVVMLEPVERSPFLETVQQISAADRDVLRVAGDIFGIVGREIGFRRGEGIAFGNLGLVSMDLGQAEKAVEFHKQVLIAARKVGFPQGEGEALLNLGLGYADLGQIEQAIACHEQALTIARKIGSRQGEGSALGNLGLAHADLGEVEQAIVFHKQALNIAREIGLRQGEGSVLGNLGLAHADLGEVRKAIEFHEQALNISREIGLRRGEGSALGNLGFAYADLGEVEQAVAFHEQALAITREIGFRRGEGSVLANLGLAYVNLGQVEKAIEYHRQALIIARDTGLRRAESGVLANLGMSYAYLGQIEKAKGYREQALTMAHKILAAARAAGEDKPKTTAEILAAVRANKTQREADPALAKPGPAQPVATTGSRPAVQDMLKVAREQRAGGPTPAVITKTVAAPPMRPIVWIGDDVHKQPDVFLRTEFLLQFMMSDQINLPSLVRKGEGLIPSSAIPATGLPTQWVVIAREARITGNGEVVVEHSDEDGDPIWYARFDLLVPREGASDVRQMQVLPLVPGPLRLMILVFGTYPVRDTRHAPLARRELMRKFIVEISVKDQI